MISSAPEQSHSLIVNRQVAAADLRTDGFSRRFLQMKLGKFFLLEVTFIIVVLVLAVMFVSWDSRLSANQGGLLGIDGGGTSNRVMINRTWSISALRILSEKLEYDGRDTSVISIYLVVKSVNTEGVLMIALNGFTVAKLGIMENSVISCVELNPKSRDILPCGGNANNPYGGNETISSHSSNRSAHISVTSTCGFNIINANLPNIISFSSSYEGDFSFSVRW